jgi:hypothetical protein
MVIQYGGNVQPLSWANRLNRCVILSNTILKPPAANLCLNLRFRIYIDSIVVLVTTTRDPLTTQKTPLMPWQEWHSHQAQLLQAALC